MNDTMPIFVLQGSDKGAPAAILEWVKIAAAEGAPAKKLRAAMEEYLRMVTWQRANPDLVKVPD